MGDEEEMAEIFGIADGQTTHGYESDSELGNFSNTRKKILKYLVYFQDYWVKKEP